MGTYVLRRILQMIPVFIGATLLIFLMVYTLPGDPIAALFGDKAADPAQVAQLRHLYYLDQPLWKQYLHYMWNLLQGNFGTSFTGRSVAALMGDAFPVTIRLALVAFAFEIFVGIPLGLLSGLKRGSLLDTLVLIGTLIVISIPVFVLANVAQQVVGVNLGWVTPTVQNSNDISQLILPGLVLGSLSLAFVTRLTRTSIGENRRADYMRTAVAKGLPQRTVISRHLLRNSLIPVVTFLGTDLGALMGGAIVTEGIFNVKGVGNLLYQAIRHKEGPTVVGVVTVLVIVYLVASLVVDLLYAVLDPRIRYA
ncbi:ABC transporter permease [Streptomyces tateyamensis]|uniref:ABC transporter permease n=1 Tax=Streptomyces tateyamensis TaxID=565073 RepID=A0A2V4N7I9_9ACTN|nr:ABC transporter permease [Streptomyces tateyamensis]PYC72107.1 ABC transporter permease [Streptomyces tateyamensis]